LNFEKTWVISDAVMSNHSRSQSRIIGTKYQSVTDTSPPAKDSSVRQVGSLLTTRFRSFPLLTTMILASPSLYFLIFVPPLWRDYDGFVQIATKIGFLTVLHFPPFYCFVARIPLFVGSLLDGTAFSSGLAINPPILTDTGLILLLLLQHLLLVCSLVFTCMSLSERRWMRWVLATLFALNPTLYAFANCIGSEALSNILVLLVIVLGLRFVRQPCNRWLKILFVALVAAMLTRHINGVLCGLLPGTLILFATWRIFFPPVTSDAPGLNSLGLSKLLQNLALVTVVGGGAIVASNATIWSLCLLLKIPHVSRIGYTFQWRLAHYLKRLDAPAREAAIASISRKLHDPPTTFALQRLEASLAKQEWDTEIVSRTIYDQLGVGAMRMTGKDIRVATDQRLNKLATALLFSNDPSFYKTIFDDFKTGLTFSPARICGEPFYGTDYLIPRLTGNLLAPLRPLRTFHFRAGTFVDLWSKNPYFHLWEGISLQWIAFATLIAVLIVFGLRPFRRTDMASELHALAAVVTGYVILLANCSVGELLPRYTLPTYILFLSAFALATSQLCEVLISSKPRR